MLLSAFVPTEKDAVCLRNTGKKSTLYIRNLGTWMHVTADSATISAVQLHHKVKQPLCPQAERQLSLSPNAKQAFRLSEAGRECGVFTKKNRVALLQRHTVTEVKHLRG